MKSILSRAVLRCTCERAHHAAIGTVADIKPSVVMGTNMWKALIDAAVRFLDVTLVCWHFNTSPFTISEHTCEACLDCSKQFSYSLRTMSLTADR
jgi:hypothetical protein